jgi:uncharacterized membrane protein
MNVFNGFKFPAVNVWFLMVNAVVLGSVVSIYALPLSWPIVLVRYVLGLLIVLFTPGYSLVKLLFAKRDLEPLEQLALSIALSMFLASVTGVLLNYTPWGIRLDPIVASLAILTIGFSSIAQLSKYYRR